MRYRTAIMLLCSLMCCTGSAIAADPPQLELAPIEGSRPRNVVFILVDDHRFDAMGCMGHPFLETPNMDRLAAGGANLTAAYVTTSLCSPSRASILTGQYAHQHRVVDNNNPVREGTVFFPQYLQQAGYKTGFFGKWHMGGESDDPRPGFDRWVSFRGQGSYLPVKSGINVDGERVPQQGYITDEITDYCLDWLKGIDREQPFFIYLSHKAVHANFTPAERHKGRYKDAVVVPPLTMADTPENFASKPRWVQDQRNSWHGVDFPYHSSLDIAEYYRNYCETLLAVDDSVGRVLQTLEDRGQLQDTLVIYMGDNGFCFGEHGLIDKRHAYEASMRVPMLAHCPQLFPGGQTIKKVVANIDIGPTVLEAAGLRTPKHMHGRSFLPILQGRQVEWRDALLYEYYWERNFPQTPTMHAVRTDRWKYIHYFGIWDTDELYDLQNDPLERTNLINSQQHAQTVKQLNRQLFEMLEETGGMYIPLNADRGGIQNLRLRGRGAGHDFPDWFYRDEAVNSGAQ
ncbi:MAG: sulfatase [Planctomycetaceae bacterium]